MLDFRKKFPYARGHHRYLDPLLPFFLVVVARMDKSTIPALLFSSIILYETHFRIASFENGLSLSLFPSFHLMTPSLGSNLPSR